MSSGSNDRKGPPEQEPSKEEPREPRKKRTPSHETLQRRLKALAAPYKVGYAKPPESANYKPGESGNPYGRPKGSRNKRRREASDQSLRALILKDAQRPIKINDANGPVTIMMAQAVRRAQGFAGLKGSVRAQRDYLDALRIAENAQQREREALLIAVGEYKLKWEAERDRCRRLGLKPPKPLIDPDDLVIDEVTGDLRIRGPATREEMARWKRYRRAGKVRLRELANERDHPGPDKRRKRILAQVEELKIQLGTIEAALGGSRRAMLVLEHAEPDLTPAFPEEK